MLKRFFSRLLPSFIGAWLALLLFGIVAAITIVVIFAKVGSTNITENVTRHSIACLELEGTIVENDRPSGIDYSSIIIGQSTRVQSLNSLVAGIREAANNKNIDALFINCKTVSASPATLNALRRCILEFKKSGKPVYAYGDNLSQGDYYVATAAGTVMLNSQGRLTLTGLNGTMLYMKGLFDKLGVTFQVFKVGTYKSAVEPYTQTEMSEPARAQLDTLYKNMWGIIAKDIAESRKITTQEINRLIDVDMVGFRDAAFAKSKKLVDEVVFQREVTSKLAKAINVDEDDLNFVSLRTLAGQSDLGMEYNAKKQIAVVFADGEINEYTKTGINCNELVPLITELADDDNVEAVVLRVNSPGGSVFGSAQIADALAYVKSRKKPFVVSMGDYAASGGYWISCEADRIFADPLTITGSIGIYGLIPQGKELAEKIGLSPQSVGTNPNGAFPTFWTSFNEAQSVAMQKEIEAGYSQFINRVAKGRKMKVEKVEAIAQGRVWDAATAQKIGLVDQLGSLDDAIDYAAKQCKITGDYSLAYYPQSRTSFWTLLNELSEEPQYKLLQSVLPSQTSPEIIEAAYRTLNRRPMQALMAPIKLIP